MFTVVILALLGLVNSAAIEKRALQPMSSSQLDDFTRDFREALLDKVAVELNATLDQSHVLKTKMDACANKIRGLEAPCKSCAKSKCQKDPSFADYLKLLNPYTFLQKPIKDMTNKLGDAVDLLGDKSLGFLNSVGGLAESEVGKIYGGLSTAFNELKTGVKAVEKGFTDVGGVVIDTAGLVGDLGSSISSSIGHSATDLGQIVVDIGSGIGDFFGGGGGLFGRKKRDDTRQCMEQQCADCRPLLLPTQQEMIKAVCGDEIINQNNTIYARSQKISAIYDTALDKAHPVVSKVEFDPTSSNSMLQLTNVYITVYMKGQYQRYKTQVPYAMMELPTTARNMALELWSKY